jgi:hypothetical protein
MTAGEREGRAAAQLVLTAGQYSDQAARSSVLG